MVGLSEYSGLRTDENGEGACLVFLISVHFAPTLEAVFVLWLPAASFMKHANY